MKNFQKAAGISLVFTFFCMCFVFPFEVFTALVNHTSMVQVLVNAFVSGLFLYGVIAYLLYSFYDYIEKRDRIEAEDRARREQNEAEKRETTDQTK